MTKPIYDTYQEFKIDQAALWNPTAENPWRSPIAKYKKSFTVEDLFELFPDRPLEALDIGCGPSKFRLREFDRVIGIDHCSFQGVDIVMNVTKESLPLKSSSIDLVICSHFIEHLTYEERDVVFLEILRVLRPGGLFYFKVPHFSHYWTAAYDHKIYNYGVGVAHTLANSGWYSHIPKFQVVGVGLNWRLTDTPSVINRIMNKLLNLSYRLSESYLCWLAGGIQEIQFLLIKPQDHLPG
jgi:SAM-dependent methyltransferase